MLQSELINSVLHKPISKTPIWLMRQAGRYLPEYRKIREKAGSFMNLCTNSELATLVTLQPLQRFDLDAAILFSDILVIPDAMGLELYFVENEGPKFNKTIDTINTNSLEIIAKLDYVFRAIKNIKSEMKNNMPLIGFSGSPFTLACYMVEGSSSKNYAKVKHMLYNEKDKFHNLLQLVTDIVILYINEQIKAGVDVVMLFDSWGGILTESAYTEFSLHYQQKIFNSIVKTYDNKVIPSISFTKGGGQWLNHMQNLNTNTIGLDWTTNFINAKRALPNMAFQGNLDPLILAVGSRDAIKKEVYRIINEYARANNNDLSGFVFNLGHGVIPITNPDNVAYLVETVHEVSSRICN